MIRKVLAVALIVLAAASMYLSWGALYDLAIATGMPPHRALVFPLVVDLVTVVAMVIAIVDDADTLSRRVYPWIALFIFGIATIAGNAIHVTLLKGPMDVDEYIAVGVNALPAVALLLTTHLAAVTIYSRDKVPRIYVYREPAGPPPASEPVDETKTTSTDPTPTPGGLRAVPPLIEVEDPRARVIELHTQGKSYRVIEEKTGVTKSTAARWVAAHKKEVNA